MENEVPEAGQSSAPTACYVAVHVNYYNAGVRTNGYDERWDKLQIHCPNCGKKEVWVRDDGDYYVGPEHLCSCCGHSFYMPSGPNDASKDEQGRQRLLAIRSKPHNATELSHTEKNK